MNEPIRLVIWDLDETYWNGTLTEGGIQYLDHNHDIVVELAHRGIMNSICSRNEFGRVRDILEFHKSWEYFVFPSINWDSKAARIEQIIDKFQLRAASVIFIDDNAMNLQETKKYIPDIQIAGPDFIKNILSDARFRGKDDRELKRLAQYKVLEQKRDDAMTALKSGISNEGFLRESDIVVDIVFDIDPHMDRAIELINRTNQLNFTKRRLPEDPA